MDKANCFGLFPGNITVTLSDNVTRHNVCCLELKKCISRALII